MTDIKIGVVAHTARMSYADALANKVDAQFISFDDGMLGATKNHIKVWTNLLAQGADWLVVLEDDAVPVDDFRYQVTQALINAPTEIVGLYLGTGYPKAWQRFIKKGLADAKAYPDANYLVSSHILHGVGTAIKASLVDDMLRMVGWMSPEEKKWPVDEQITHWARMRAHKVCYTVPSLVDHLDGPSTISDRHDGDDRESPRKAWQFGTRHRWVNTSVEMP